MPSPASIADSVKEKKKFPGFRTKAILITLGMAAFLAALIFGGFFGLKYFADGRFPSGTKIAGLDISYKTPEGALKLLERESEEFLNSEIEITVTRAPEQDPAKNVPGDVLSEASPAPDGAAVPGRDFSSLEPGATADLPSVPTVDPATPSSPVLASTFTPKQLGINLSTKKTVDSLIPFNAQATPLKNFLFSQKSLKISPLVTIDEKIFKSELEKAFGLSKIAPIPANFYLENQKLLTREGTNGYVFDKDGIILELKKSAATLKSKSLKTELVYGPSEISVATLEGLREDTKSALFHGFTLIDPVYSDNWDESLIKHADWVIFEPTKEKINLKIDKEALDAYIDKELSKWLDRPADKVKISRDEKDKVVFEGLGSDGLQIERPKLKEAIELAVQNRTKDIPIPVITKIPELEISKDLQDLGIKERISVGHTSFYGSPANRIHNIKTAAAVFNGLLISPDATFSFNKNLGRVDGSTGYLKELVIKPEGTLPEYGGGVCQVSTTMYRAILFSGLPVVERNQHSYAVSYYSQILGHGLDATIYLGGPDLKFKNDTDGNVLVQAFLKNDYELYFVFYGSPTNRTVKLDGPYLSNYRYPGATIYQDTANLKKGQSKQQEKAHTGFDALWYRYVTNVLTGEITKETISTHYKAIPAKILVGTGE